MAMGYTSPELEQNMAAQRRFLAHAFGAYFIFQIGLDHL